MIPARGQAAGRPGRLHGWQALTRMQVTHVLPFCLMYFVKWLLQAPVARARACSCGFDNRTGRVPVLLCVICFCYAACLQTF